MSLLIESSPEHCANRGLQLKKLILNKKLICTLSSLLSSLLLLLLLLYILLRPSNPEFFLRDTSVDNLSLLSSSPRLLNSSIYATVLSKNPNSRVGVYYDGMRAYAVYKGQQITQDSPLPSSYLAHGDSTLLSASLCGAWMPVAASVGYEVARDQGAGRFVLSVRVDGRLRWKVLGWVSGWRRFDVDCTAVVGLRPGAAGLLSGGTQCSTSV